MPTLLISMDFPPHKDGITTLAAELAKRLGDDAGEFVAIGPCAPGACEYDSVQKYRIYRSPFYDYGYLKLLPLLILVPYVVFKHKIDKIIATNVGYGGFIAWLLKKISNIRYIVTAQGYEFLKFKDNWLIKKIYLWIYEEADAIVACSSYVRDMLIEFGGKAEKIFVVYPGVDLSKYREQNAPGVFLDKYALRGKKILLTVSRLVDRKGHDFVIKAMKRIVNEVSDILYVIVGKGPAKEYLEKIISDNGLSDKVKFIGEVSEEELVYFYNASDLLIMPSRIIEKDGHVEGFGIVFLEANACGKPVIGGRSGGVPEAIINGKTGLLADPTNESDIAEKMLMLIKDPAYAKRLGDAGKNRVLKDFNWDNYAGQFRKFLKI